MHERPTPLPARVTTHTVERFLAAARDGQSTALPKLLNFYRAYLLMIAKRDLEGPLRTKEAPSDLVQETVILAQRRFAGESLHTEEEFRFWLRKLLKNKLRAHKRRYGRGTKRDVAKEVPLFNLESKLGLFELAAQVSDSVGGELDRAVLAQRIESALARLPEGYRHVIEWHHRDELSFSELAERLGRSPAAVRMLWVRALKRLKKELGRSIDS